MKTNHQNISDSSETILDLSARMNQRNGYATSANTVIGAGGVAGQTAQGLFKAEIFAMLKEISSPTTISRATESEHCFGRLKNALATIEAKSRYRLKASLLAIALIMAICLSVAPALALDPPTISPGTGSFMVPQSVIMTASSGTIYFTTDGTVPTTASTAYSSSSPPVVSSPTQLNAVAYSSGTYSQVATAYLDVDSSSAPLFLSLPRTFTISGTLHTGDVVSVSVYDNRIVAASGKPAGQRTYSHSVVSSTDTYSSIASDLSSQFTGDTALSGVGITSSHTSTNPYFVLSSSVNQTTYAQSVSPTGNEQIMQSGGPVLRLTTAFGVISNAGSPAPITEWIDLSGSNFNASASFGSQPTLVSLSPTGSAVNFDGISQYFSLPAGFANFTAGGSFFMVVEPISPGTGARLFDLGNGSASNNIYMSEPTSSEADLHVYNGSTGSSISLPTNTVNAGQFQLLEGTYSGTNTATIYVNGEQPTPSTSMQTASNTTRSSNFIGQASGGGDYFSGRIIEALFYSAQVTEAQRTAVEAYFIQRAQLLAVTPSAPVISVAGGTLTGPTQVVISSEPGTITYITTDGSTPDSSKTVYCGCPMTINYTQTLKAIAIKNGVPSGVASAAYTLDSTRWPAPGSDTTAPTINLQLPVSTQ